MPSDQERVADLRQRIAHEFAAMQNGLNGFSMTAKHEMLNHKYQSVMDLANELAEYIGEHEAFLYVCGANDEQILNR